MKKYKAVFFDFDGVIGKTMEDNYRAWKYAFCKYNIPVDKTEYFLMEGMSAKKIAEHFLKNNRKNNVMVEKLEKSKITELIVTDTIPLKKEHKKIKVLSVADMFADVISNVVKFESIASHFVI